MVRSSASTSEMSFGVKHDNRGNGQANHGRQYVKEVGTSQNDGAQDLKIVRHGNGERHEIDGAGHLTAWKHEAGQQD